MIDETARMRAVDGLGLLGTPPEERFDRITRLACALFDVPMSAVMLMGRDHQWCKAATGLDGLDGGSIPREETLCDHTIRENRMVVVEDLTRDARFAANRYVREPPHLRFYAGLPLAAPNGQPVGTLCLFGDRPRTLAEPEQSTLRELGRWAQSEFNQVVELDRAAEIQRGLLPDRAGLRVPGHELAVLCVPSRTVGGDLVDYYLTPDGHLVLTLGDVMGKGIGASIMMATVRAALRTTSRRLPPAEAVAAAAATLDEDLQRTGTLVTLYHSRFDLTDGSAEFVDAGHGLCLKVTGGSVVEQSPRLGGLPLGVRTGDSWVGHHSQLLPGDALVAFSDGLLDLFPDLDSAFDEIVRVVTTAPDAAAVVAHFEALARSVAVSDDVAMIVLRKETIGSAPSA